MTVYQINKGIGRASSGIEYAQGYRNKIFTNLSVDKKFIYTDYIPTNLINYTERFNIKNEDVIWLYGILADHKSYSSTYTIEKFEECLLDKYEKKEFDRYIEYRLPQQDFFYKLWKINDNYIDKIEEIRQGKILTTSHYSHFLTNKEYFSDGKLISRVFFKESGQIAYRQFYENKNITLTFVEGKCLVGRNAFFKECFKKLKWGNDDVVILDRSLDVADAILPIKGKTKIVVVIHAEHYVKSRSESNWISWNSFYEYVFTNDKWIDYFIVSTNKQKIQLEKHFEIMKKNKNRIITIPVGSIEEVSSNLETEEPVSKFITASRLAKEKNIDVLIEAVVKARKKFPTITFSIYGEGGQKSNLKLLIKQLHAENYIFIKGHMDLKEEYPKHHVYLSASGSEGFGLSILEAIGHGLPVIGLDVPYGNQEFVLNGKNGFLVQKKNREENIINLAKSIEKVASAGFNKIEFSKYSQKKAAQYTDEVVRKQWLSFLNNIDREEV